MNDVEFSFDLEFCFDLARVDWERVTGWLAGSYWSPGITRAHVEQGAQASTVVIAAFLGGEQVGYARVLSDTVRFAYLADVYVAEAQRGQGLARHMIAALLAHPRIAGVAHCYLLTGTPAVYHSLGFATYPAPDRFMVRSNPDALDFTKEP